MITLRPYQQECIDVIGAQAPGAYLVQMATGLGKCLGKGTKVLMYDGTVRLVETISEGDLVMGPDSLPRRVCGLARGVSKLYKVIPVKGDPYIVNEAHILSLKITNMSANGKKCVTGPDGKRYSGGEVCNVSVADYLNASPYFKHVAKGWRVGISFGKQTVTIPPYILGVWLADGTSVTTNITTADPEVVRELHRYSQENGLSLCVVSSKTTGKSLTYSIVNKNDAGRGANAFRSALKSYGLLGNKHIPQAYLHNDEQIRLELLAGLLDGDGYLIDGSTYEIASCRDDLAESILFLARSLGFAAYDTTKTVNGVPYHRINISGETESIPVRVQRRIANKRWQKKNVLVTGISVESAGIGEYYGFELQGPDRLFVLGDFTVTHNTVTFSQIPREGRMLILSHREELVKQPLKYFDCMTGIEMANESASPMAEVVSASVPSLTRRLKRFAPSEFDLIICDEAHHAAAASYRRIFDHFHPRMLIGFTATPNRGDKVRLDNVFQDIIFQRDLRWGIENGYLSDIYCRRVNIGYDLSNVSVRHGDYAPGELDEAMDGTADAVAETYEKMAEGATLIFATSVKQAHEIAEKISGAVAVTGETRNRAEIIAAFTRREIPCIVNCMVFTEGTDMPLIETIIVARPTKSESLYAQMVGRGLRLHPEKQRLNLIDCVGVSSNSLCTAPSLLGIDVDDVPPNKREAVEGMLFDLPTIAAGLADCPESWIQNVQIVNLWAKGKNLTTHNVNWFKQPDGSLTLSLPSRRMVIPPEDSLGRVRTADGKHVSMQTALNIAYEWLMTREAEYRPLWDLNAVKRWGRGEVSEKQRNLIQRRFPDLDMSEMTKGDAAMILNRIMNDWRRSA